MEHLCSKLRSHFAPPRNKGGAAPEMPTSEVAAAAAAATGSAQGGDDDAAGCLLEGEDRAEMASSRADASFDEEREGDEDDYDVRREGGEGGL